MCVCVFAQCNEARPFPPSPCNAAPRVPRRPRYGSHPGHRHGCPWHRHAHGHRHEVRRQRAAAPQRRPHHQRSGERRSKDTITLHSPTINDSNFLLYFLLFLFCSFSLHFAPHLLLKIKICLYRKRKMEKRKWTFFFFGKTFSLHIIFILIGIETLSLFFPLSSSFPIIWVKATFWFKWRSWITSR